MPNLNNLVIKLIEKTKFYENENFLISAKKLGDVFFVISFNFVLEKASNMTTEEAIKFLRFYFIDDIKVNKDTFFVNSIMQKYFNKNAIKRLFVNKDFLDKIVNDKKSFFV